MKLPFSDVIDGGQGGKCLFELCLLPLIWLPLLVLNLQVFKLKTFSLYKFVLCYCNSVCRALHLPGAFLTLALPRLLVLSKKQQ